MMPLEQEWKAIHAQGYVICLQKQMEGDELYTWKHTKNAEPLFHRVLGYINAPHMGVRKLGLRFGMYTDDTQTTLALATSIVENQALVPRHAGILSLLDYEIHMLSDLFSTSLLPVLLH